MAAPPSAPDGVPPTRDAPLVHPMTAIYRGLFIALVLMGLTAVAIGAAGLLDLPLEFLREEGTTSAELWVAVVVGAGLAVFGASALPHTRLRLDGVTLEHLAFGPLCRTGSVKLEEVVRFGTGVEKHGYQRKTILVVELRDGSTRRIQLSMYVRPRAFVEALGACLGQAAAAGKQGWTGVHLEDD